MKLVSMKHKILLCLFSLLLFSSNTYSCTTILNESPVVNRNNVRNQDGLGWCYSYVAADLLSYKTGKKISAIGLVRPGIYFDIVIPRERISGFTAKKTLEFVKNQKNLCLESEINSSEYLISRDNKISPTLYLHDILSDIQKIYQEGREVIRQNIVADEKNLPTRCLSSKSMQRLNEIFPGVTCKTVLEIVSTYTKQGFLDQLIRKSCQSFKVPKFEAVTTYNTEYFIFDKDLVKDIDQALESKTIAGIGYNYARITNMKGEANHASLVVGRRLNPKTKQCEYLIRNSHGKNCSARNPESRCDTSCANDFNKNCQRENGYFWVTKRLLQEMTYSVTVLK